MTAYFQRLISLLLIILGGMIHSSADDQSSGGKTSGAELHHWRAITFAQNNPSSGNMKYPDFSIYCDNPKQGMHLILDFNDPAYDKPNMILACLHRENGETVYAVGGNLNTPLPEPVTVNPYPPGAPPTAWTAETFFPWGKNNMDESWIEVSMGQERYWLEIPYGFDRNPQDPLPSAMTEKRPLFVAPIKTKTDYDHIVPWDQVYYDFGSIQNGWGLSLNFSNPGDGVGEVVLYREKSAWDLYTPRTSLEAIDADGSEIGSTCTSIRLDEDLEYGRDDTFSLYRYPCDLDVRCWGHIEIKVDNKSYRIVVPSSMYKFGQGHPASP